LPPLFTGLLLTAETSELLPFLIGDYGYFLVGDTSTGIETGDSGAFSSCSCSLAKASGELKNSIIF